MDQLDILVGCAGANKPQPISDITLETIDWLMDLNIRADIPCITKCCKDNAEAGFRINNQHVLTDGAYRSTK